MSEQKNEILAAVGRELPGMSEKDKTYLMGFLEGLAAKVGNQQMTAEMQSSG